MANRTNKEVNEKIGAMLKAAREKRNVTQAEMADHLGMGRNIIYMVESGGSKTSVEVLLGYCDKLGITPNELLQVKEDNIPTDLKKQIVSLSEPEQDTLLEMLIVYESKKKNRKGEIQDAL